MEIKDQELFKEFCWFIQERESIRKKKEAGESPPWTNDPILQQFKFCNIWRQDDAVTKVIQMNLLAIEDVRDVILNAIWMRTLNNVKSIQASPIIAFEKLGEFVEKVGNKKLRYGDAYVTVPSWKLKKGTTRNQATLQVICSLHRNMQGMPISYIQRHMTEYLLPIYWFVGLPRYEILLDIWQRLGIREQFCNVGPGAALTLKRIFQDEREINQNHVDALLYEFQKALPEFSHPQWGELTMRCIEGAACEWRKYLSLKNNPKARKRKYANSGSNSI